tara:strand:- start:3243 stop:4283 length:1041 start_codon:yes stop_codon:yes gene_type:complete
MTSRYDPENMFSSIWSFPENLEDALKLGDSIQLKQNYENINSIVVAGMGGSAIGGDVVSVLGNSYIKIPFTVCRGYSLPNWVNENTLVICSSYSGNTEETLSTLDDALKKNAKVCGITTGGKIGEKLKELGKDMVLIPSGLQPRAALAFSFIPIAKLLEKAELLDLKIKKWITKTIYSLKSSREIYSEESAENPVYELAKKIHKKLPIIYSDNSTLGVAAVRLKGQICENGKMLAYNNNLPELNHNEIVGWENNQNLFNDLFVLWLTDEDDNSRIKHRQDITQSILKQSGVNQFVIQVTGNSFQERFLLMIHYGDWLSYWCAILHGTNPSPVEKISRLKEELSKRL